MVTSNNDEWLRFLDTLAKCMTKFDSDKSVSIEGVTDPLESFRNSVSTDILNFTIDTISEKYGFPNNYAEVRKLAEAKASEIEFRSLMLK